MRSLKPLTALALTAAGSALIVGFQVPSAGAAGAATVAATGSSTTSDTGSSTTTDTGAGTGSGSTTTASTSQYADGTYLGEAVDEPWGTFQVQANVSGGQLVEVTIVAAPTDGHSSRINNQVIPTLTSAALTSQSANVDVISGATWTSESYATSLQAALDASAAAQDAAA